MLKLRQLSVTFAKAPVTKSGRRGSNPRPTAWKAVALPTELLPHKSSMKVWKYESETHFSYSISTLLYFLLKELFYWKFTSTLPYFHTSKLPANGGIVGKDGFEPPNSGENRFTVCCRWPLDYLPDGNHCLRPTGF